jgi:methylphosphotriester-DNA--protein-cysteine methyltransferase
VDRLQPHTSEILHHHHGGSVIHRHHHEYHQLIYVSTGVLAIHTEQGAWVASRDRAAWVPAGTWHEHRAYGMTYPQWRTNVRVFHAMIQLAEGATVTETAHACGWATASAFVDTFTRTMGQTPGAYRSGSAGSSASGGRVPAEGGA